MYFSIILIILFLATWATKSLCVMYYFVNTVQILSKIIMIKIAWPGNMVCFFGVMNQVTNLNVFKIRDYVVDYLPLFNENLIMNETLYGEYTLGYKIASLKNALHLLALLVLIPVLVAVLCFIPYIKDYVTGFMIWKSVQRMFTLVMSEVIFLCLVNLKSVKGVDAEGDDGSWRTTTNLVPLFLIGAVFLAFGPLNWYVGSRL